MCQGRRTVGIRKNLKLNIMIYFDKVTGKSRQENNPEWPQTSDNPCRILIAGSSGSEKRITALLN